MKNLEIIEMLTACTSLYLLGHDPGEIARMELIRASIEALKGPQTEAMKKAISKALDYAREVNNGTYPGPLGPDVVAVKLGIA